jgi:hypothetical protein
MNRLCNIAWKLEIASFSTFWSITIIVGPLYPIVGPSWEQRNRFERAGKDPGLLLETTRRWGANLTDGSEES